MTIWNEAIGLYIDVNIVTNEKVILLDFLQTSAISTCYLYVFDYYENNNNKNKSLIELLIFLIVFLQKHSLLNNFLTFITTKI